MRKKNGKINTMFLNCFIEAVINSSPLNFTGYG